MKRVISHSQQMHIDSLIQEMSDLEFQEFMNQSYAHVKAKEVQDAMDDTSKVPHRWIATPFGKRCSKCDMVVAFGEDRSNTGCTESLFVEVIRDEAKEKPLHEELQDAINKQDIAKLTALDSSIKHSIANFLGLTALDVFAIAAMQGLVHDILIDQHCEDVLMKNDLKTEEFHDFLANMSYDVATSMLAEKKRREGTPTPMDGYYDIRMNSYRLLIRKGDLVAGLDLYVQGDDLRIYKKEVFGMLAEITLHGGPKNGSKVTLNI